MIRPQSRPQTNEVERVRADARRNAPRDPKHPTDDEMKSAILDDLKHEQTLCVRLLPIWRRNMHVSEGMEISWAMNAAVSTYTELDADKITWQEAFKRCTEQVSAKTSAFLVALEVDAIKRREAAARAKVQAQIEDWIRRGWLFRYSDGGLEFTEQGRAHADEIRQIVQFG